ncbi:fungal specific transcription factor domain-containing protein [Colletotrichum truncatum]|uniref:Fungal specific transcription factor domain-containing protein n=1 Tax=Colletotrichum truncatum TaxID=5467 RepID=A0ACC3Z7V4_COLTU|nr:fungal specific transcription factor domain-containing protein [Colletotrichum truncatum]KAF6782515.1 fungal specific transcription factor domain-containing protein [Colletotrichum truncatum]
MQSPKTLLFLGATGGCGLSALRRSLDAGFTCIALCRTPSKLTAVLSPETYPKLHVVEGNAHDAEAIAKCLVLSHDPSRFVDVVVSTIGAWFDMHKMNLEDVHVCEKGMTVLLDTIKTLRTEKKVSGNPRVIGQSSTGISKFGRDTPLVIYPLYKGLLHTPHEDKRAMEELLVSSDEDWTVLRASFLTNGKEEPSSAVKVGVEDPVKGVEDLVIGYTISREDVGKWMFENILNKDGKDRYVRKVATITY